MKKHKFFITIYITFTMSNVLLSQEQEIIDTVKTEFIYNYTLQQDSSSQSSLKSLLMILQVGNHYSRFTGENIPTQDSIFVANKNSDVQHTINLLMPLISSQPISVLVDYDIYKNLPEKGTIEMKSTLSNDDHYSVVQKNKLLWKIINNADSTILGLPCKKATTNFAGRSYIAWFTMKIPVNDGPYKFYGLPGLIVLIEDIQKQHRFEIISIIKPRYVKPIYYEQRGLYINITMPQYIKAIGRESNRRYQMVSNMQDLTEEKRARALRNTLMKNNFIERY